MANSILDLGDMRAYLAPKVTNAGGMIDILAFRGSFADPAHDAIDLANDGILDWQFSSSPDYGSYGWQTRMDASSTTHSMSVNGNGTMSVLVPHNAANTLLLGINPSGTTNPMVMKSGSNSFCNCQSVIGQQLLFQPIHNWFLLESMLIPMVETGR